MGFFVDVQDAGVVADAGEGAGFVGEGDAVGQKAGETLVEGLLEQDVEHGVTVGRAGDVAAVDHSTETGHVASGGCVVGGATLERNTVTVHRVGGALLGDIAIEAVGVGELCAVHVVEDAADVKGEMDVADAEFFHQGVDLCDAQPPHDHVGRGVVADDDHQGEQVARGGVEALL